MSICKCHFLVLIVQAILVKKYIKTNTHIVLCNPSNIANEISTLCAKCKMLVVAK